MLLQVAFRHPIPQQVDWEAFMQIQEDPRRDPEDRSIDENDLCERKEKMLDKTIADTFPASDPPSSLPDPDDDSFAA
jgi:hypothetical protein